MSSRLKLFYPLLICLWLGVSFTAYEAAPLPQAASNHPSLFFTASDIPAMREATQTTHAAIWDPISDNAVEILTEPAPATPPANADFNFFRSEGSRLISMAFACVITDRNDYCQYAENRMLAHASWPVWDENDQLGLGEGHMIFGNALAYDWLYDKLSDSQRATIRASLLDHGNQLYVAGSAAIPNPQAATWWYKSYYQNHFYIMNSALGMAGLALRNDLVGLDTTAERASTPQDWLTAVASRLTIGQTILNNISDGTWHEGIPYQNYMLTFLIAFTSNYRDLTGQDIMPNTYLQNYADWRLYNFVENGDFILTFGDFDWEWANGYSPQALLRFIAGEYNNPTAEWLAQEIVGETGRPDFESPWHVFEFLYYDPSVGAQEPINLPLSYRSTDEDAVIWRTGWENDDLVFGLKSGAFAGRYGYTTFINGSAPWELPCSDNGCQLNIGHDHNDINSFTLFNDGEWLVPENVYLSAYDTSLHNTVVIDGQNQYRPPANRYEQYPEDYAGSDGVLETVANGSFYDYLVSDATGRYMNIGGIQNVTRRVLYLHPGYFLILDDLAADSAHQYKAVVHFPDDITQQDRWLSGRTRNGQILGVNVVAPQSFNINLDNSGEYPAAQIAPSANTNNARIIYSVIPSDNATWAQRPTTSLLYNEPTYSLIRVQLTLPSSQLQDVLISYTEQPTLVSNELYSANAALAVVGHDGAGTVKQVGLHRGTFVRNMSTGNYLLANVSADETYDVEHIGTTVSIQTTQVAHDGAIIFAPTATAVAVNGSSHPFLRCDNYVVVGTTIPQVDGISLTNCSLVTPTPGENLLSNASFEDADTLGSPRLTGWQLKNEQHDKVVCDKVPTIAFKGDCAFRFKSKGVITGAKLTQVVDLTGKDIQTGDALRLAFAYQLDKSQAELKVKCVIGYRDPNLPKTKLKQTLGQTTGYQSFSTDIPLDSPEAASVTVELIHKSQTAKGYVDAARLEIIRAGIPQLLPLP